MDGGHNVSWEELTRSMTGALAGIKDVWAVVEDAIDSPDEIWRKENEQSPVWSLRLGRITPRPRRSILDYARVMEGTSYHISWQRVMPWRPARNPEMRGDDPQSGTWNIEVRGDARRSLLQVVDRNATARDGGNVVRDAFASMRDEVILDVEREVRARLAGTGKEDGLAYELYLQNTRGRGSYEKVSLGARHVLDAARRIVEGCPQVPFPHGLFCLLSPSQAVQLLREGTLDADRMSVCGIDVVVSPVVGDRTEIEDLGAMVAAKGSVGIAMGTAKVRMVQGSEECNIGLQYSMGAAITPRMTARIVTERGGGSLEGHG